MIKLNDLQEAIAECEGQKNPNANTCIKLAAFYTIRNNLYPDTEQAQVPMPMPAYSYSNSGAEYTSDTEFGRIVNGKSYNEILQVMDELMSTLEIVNPRLYNGVLRKLTE